MTRGPAAARRAGMIAAIALFSSPSSFAAGVPDGARFLQIGAGARAQGMGAAFTAVADDATAGYWNPAGLARLSRTQASATHMTWLADSSFEHAAFARPSPAGTLSGALTMLSQDGFESRDENRRRRGDFSALDTAVAVSFSRPASGRFSTGIGVKMVEQRIGDARARGIAWDGGLLGRFGGGRFSWGIAVQNFGTRLRLAREAYQMPLTVATGVACKPSRNLQLALDVKRLVHQGRTQIGAGSELDLGRVALRSGYSVTSGPAGLRVGGPGLFGADPGELHLGFGLKLAAYALDYSFAPYGPMGNAHQISLAVSF